MTSATIERLTAHTVRVPMPHPHRTAAGTVHESPLVLVELSTSDGVLGRGMAFTYCVEALAPTARLIDNAAPLLVGAALSPADISRTLTAKFRLVGTHGLTGMAMAAIDMAAWDALARSAGLSLVRLLGARARPIPVYGGIGYDGADESAAQAAAWAEQGVRGVKPKIGYPTLAEDLAVVRAIRGAVGPDIEIMVDYNQSLDPAEARVRLRALDDEGLAWIEEPLGSHDYTGMAALAREIRTPLQAGESWWGPEEFGTAVQLRASEHLMPDVMKVGGVTGWLRVAGLAAAHQLPVSSHLFPEISAQLLCATPTAHRLEYADWWNPVLEQPLTVEGGHAVIDEDAPGSGVSWDDDVLVRYAND